MRGAVVIGLGLALGCAGARPYPLDARTTVPAEASVWLPAAPYRGLAPRVTGPAADAIRLRAGHGDAGVRTSFTVDALALSSDGEVVAVAGPYRARVIGRGTSTPIELPEIRDLQRIAISPAADRLALESYAEALWLVDVATAEVRALRPGARRAQRQTGPTIGFSADGSILHAGRRLWSASSGEPVTMPGDAQDVLWMSSDAGRVLVAELRADGRGELVPGHFEAAGYERHETQWSYRGGDYAFRSRIDAAQQPLAVAGYPRHLRARSAAVLFSTHSEPETTVFATADGSAPVEREADRVIAGLDLAADGKHAATWTRGRLQLWPTDAPGDVIAELESPEIAGAFVGKHALVVHGRDLRVLDVPSGAVRYVDRGTRPRTYIHQIAVASSAPRFAYLRSATHVLSPADLDAPAPAAQGAAIVDLAVAPDGRVASIGADGSVWQWRPDGSGMPLPNGDFTTPQPSDGFHLAGLTRHAVRFSRDGRLIVASMKNKIGYVDGLTRAWASETGEVRYELRGRFGALLPGGDVILELDGVGHARTKWTAAGERVGALPRWEHRGEFVGVEGAAFTLDGATAYVGVFDRARSGWFIQRRDAESGRALDRLSTTAARPWIVRLDRAQTTLLVVSNEAMRVIDLAADEVAWHGSLGTAPRVAALSAQGDVVALGHDDGAIQLWAQGRVAATIDLSAAEDAPSALAWGDGVLYVGTRHGVLLRFDVDMDSVHAAEHPLSPRARTPRPR